jgi:hypothetical protein
MQRQRWRTTSSSVIRGSSLYSSPPACTACARASAMHRSARAPPQIVAAPGLSSILSTWCTMSENLSWPSSASCGSCCAARRRRPPSAACGSSAAVVSFHALALKLASCCSVASLNGAIGSVVLLGLPAGKMLRACGSTSPKSAFQTSSRTYRGRASGACVLQRCAVRGASAACVRQRHAVAAWSHRGDVREASPSARTPAA